MVVLLVSKGKEPLDNIPKVEILRAELKVSGVLINIINSWKEVKPSNETARQVCPIIFWTFRKAPTHICCVSSLSKIAEDFHTKPVPHPTIDIYGAFGFLIITFELVV